MLFSFVRIMYVACNRFGSSELGNREEGVGLGRATLLAKTDFNQQIGNTEGSSTYGVIQRCLSSNRRLNAQVFPDSYFRGGLSRGSSLKLVPLATKKDT
jgi:hypothetical protein